MEIFLIAVFVIILILISQIYLNKVNPDVVVSNRRILILDMVFFHLISAPFAIIYTILTGFNWINLIERLMMALTYAFAFGLVSLIIANSGSNSLLTSIVIKMLKAKLK